MCLKRKNLGLIIQHETGAIAYFRKDIGKLVGLNAYESMSIVEL